MQSNIFVKKLRFFSCPIDKRQNGGIPSAARLSKDNTPTDFDDDLSGCFYLVFVVSGRMISKMQSFACPFLMYCGVVPQIDKGESEDGYNTATLVKNSFEVFI